MSRMTPIERRAVAVLASIYGLRIFGLFLILPVFAVYAAGLDGNTPLLIGLALGAYGLTQALLQIPFGAWSDRFGRKPLIIGGLIIFALGSVIAARADSIAGVILGRAIQGAGAIPAVVMALVADLTRDEQRIKAMAVIGMTIGSAFVISLVAGPLLDGWIGVPGIFWLIAVLALTAIAILLALVPTPVRARSSASSWRQLPRILSHPELLRFNVGIFVLHLILTAMFVVLPQTIIAELGIAVDRHWELYLPTMLAALATMVPFIMLANRKQRSRPVMLGAVMVLALAQGTLFFAHQSLTGLLLSLWLFFSAFNLLEAMLPSLISRQAPADAKGAAIGVYSTSQFLGAFVGGVVGGGLLGVFGPGSVFVVCAVLLLIWFVVALPMTEPEALKTRLLSLGPHQLREAEQLAEKLGAVPGVREAVVIAEEGVAYLKVDPAMFDETSLRQFRA